MKSDVLITPNSVDRRRFIGGSDARVITGDDDEAALLRLWREKRGEVEPEDLSGNLIVQLGVVTHRFERDTERRALRTACKRLLVIFDCRRFPEAHPGPSSVLVDELDAGTSQHRLDCSERCCIACIPADLDISDRVPMEAGCFREVPHSPIQRCSSHSYLCTCHSS